MAILIKLAVKGTGAFAYINNPILVMAKIELIEWLLCTKRVKGSENQTITLDLQNPNTHTHTHTHAQSLKSIQQLMVIIFPLKRLFQALSFWGKFYFHVVLSFKCLWNLIFSFLGLQTGHACSTFKGKSNPNRQLSTLKESRKIRKQSDESFN